MIFLLALRQTPYGDAGAENLAQSPLPHNFFHLARLKRQQSKAHLPATEHAPSSLMCRFSRPVITLRRCHRRKYDPVPDASLHLYQPTIAVLIQHSSPQRTRVRYRKLEERRQWWSDTRAMARQPMASGGATSSRRRHASSTRPATWRRRTCATLAHGGSAPEGSRCLSSLAAPCGAALIAVIHRHY
jgi:hypothetical protein